MEPHEMKLNKKVKGSQTKEMNEVNELNDMTWHEKKCHDMNEIRGMKGVKNGDRNNDMSTPDLKTMVFLIRGYSPVVMIWYLNGTLPVKLPKA